MSKLDEINPSFKNNMYKVELQVEGEWVLLTTLSKSAIIKLTQYADKLQDEESDLL